MIAEVDELRGEWGVEFPQPKIAIDKVRARKEKVIATLSGGLIAGVARSFGAP